MPASAETPASGEATATPADGGATPSRQRSPAVLAAIASLSRAKRIPAAEIAMAGAEHVEWPDSSLGNPQPGIMYSQIVTPGWRVFLDARGQSYEYHTNLDGIAVTLVTNAPVQGAPAQSS